jgi:ParB family chromosome partitioning protein
MESTPQSTSGTAPDALTVPTGPESWQEALPMLLVAIESGTSTGVRMAKAHLTSMAKAADFAASGTSLARLDPLTVHTPAWMRFRAPQSTTDQVFAALKASVTSTGGNVQPIKVRPGQPGRFDLVFGSLRLQACLELGLPVLAAIEPVDTLRALEELDASNGNEQVSLYERGCLYEAALQAGLYPSRRRLAERLGRDLSDVANACGLAQLPKEAVALLRDPRQLTAAAGKRLAKAMATDPERFAERVQTLAQRSRHSDRALALKDWLSALAP